MSDRAHAEDFAGLSHAVRRIVCIILCEGWTAEQLDVMSDLQPSDIEAAVEAVEEHPAWDRSICS